MAQGKEKKSTVGVCEALAEPLAEELGVSIWDVAFEKEGAGWYLRYFIETDNGVTIEECEVFSRRISDVLDAADPIEQSYCLEVSSPGIERKFTRQWHYEKYLGAQVLVRLIRPVEGVRDFVGKLKTRNPEDGCITVELEEDLEMTFNQEETAFVRLYEEI